MVAEPHIAIDVDHGAIEAFCRKWGIRELSLFGSVLREDFRVDSDIDVLVTFDDAQRSWGPWMAEWFRMEEELAAIFGRKVDVVEKRTIENSANYIRRNRILRNQRPIYVAR